MTVGEHLARLRIAGKDLRRLEVMAASIGVTEDQAAATLDRLVRTRPRYAARLRARAKRAPQFATGQP